MLRDIEDAWFDAPREICKYVYSFMKPIPRILKRIPLEYHTEIMHVFDNEWVTRIPINWGKAEYINIYTDEMYTFIDGEHAGLCDGCITTASNGYLQWVDTDGMKHRVLHKADRTPVRKNATVAEYDGWILEGHASEPRVELDMSNPDEMMILERRGDLILYTEVSTDADGVLHKYHVVATMAE